MWCDIPLAQAEAEFIHVQISQTDSWVWKIWAQDQSIFLLWLWPIEEGQAIWCPYPVFLHWHCILEELFYGDSNGVRHYMLSHIQAENQTTPYFWVLIWFTLAGWNRWVNIQQPMGSRGQAQKKFQKKISL